MRKFDLDDILIEPEVITYITSRKEVNPYDSNNMLPIFTAPMDTVVGLENVNEYLDKKINVCLPRGDIYYGDNVFNSYSLNQFKDEFLRNKRVGTFNVLIDMANGHMNELVHAVKMAKEEYSTDMILMVGNVANPETYLLLSKAGADYIRIGIGNGNGCLTTQQLGVGYPMGSLIKECYEVSCALENPAKIVADGGMKKYSDIIKSLAIGADYVMIGSLFNKALESSGQCHEEDMLGNIKPISMDDAKESFSKGYEVKKLFRGMSTKEVQKKWGNKELKTSEGIVKYQNVEYTLEGFIKNFEDYLRSAMSYTNSNNLNEFIGNVKYNLITQNSFNRFNK